MGETRDGCLRLELCNRSDGNRLWFTVSTACVEHVLTSGLVSKNSVLKAEEPLTSSCCELAGRYRPIEVDQWQFGEESSYFQPERVLSSGSQRSASTSYQLKLVESDDNQDFSQHLAYACAHGLKDAVQVVLNRAQDIDLNTPLAHSTNTGTNEQGLTPLSLAALSNSVVLCTLLVKAGADLNVTDHLGRSALHWAVLGECLGAVKGLLKLGADSNGVDDQGFTPLHYGCIFGLQKIVSALLKEGSAQVDQSHRVTKDTPLMFSCSKGHVDTCKLLLKHRANPQLVNDQGLTPLHCSVWGGDVKCVKTVLGRVNINCKDKYGRTPLHIAAIKGNSTLCQLLQKKGAELSDVDNEGRTVLHWAVISGQASCVEYLLRHETVTTDSLNRQDHTGVTASHYAAIQPSGDTLIQLQSKGADLSLTDSNGYTPLVWAATFSCQSTTEILLSQHCEEDAPDNQSNEFTPLHAAACVGSVDICQHLLTRHSQSVHTPTVQGYTPLHYASRFGHLACAQSLLVNGAKVDAVTVQLETSLHLACLYGHAEIARELVSRSASRLESLETNGNWPVHTAATVGNTDVLDILISNDIDLLDQPRKSDNKTPLLLAASNGHLPSCKLLISRGCNSRATDNNVERHTSLDLAMTNGHVECADYLMSCHVPSRGGVYHRAAATIQAVWRYHRHKVRQDICRRWSAVMIQRAFRQWLGRRCALRVRRARTRHRYRAALIIQTKWREFISQRRRYETSYARLKAKLYQETLATALILSELNLHTQTVCLPPPMASRSKSSSRAGATISGPNPKYLLQASTNPAPIFPSGSLLFPAKPRTPLANTASPPKTNKNKHGNPITHYPSCLKTIKESPCEGLRINSRNKVRFPPLNTSTHSHANMVVSHKFVPINSVTNTLSTDNVNPREHSTSTEQLPKVPSIQCSLVAIPTTSSSHNTVPYTRPELALDVAKSRWPRSEEGKSGEVCSFKQTPSSIKIPSQAQLKLTRRSTFKDTPLKCRCLSPRGKSTDEREMNHTSKECVEVSEDSEVSEILEVSKVRRGVEFKGEEFLDYLGDTRTPDDDQDNSQSDPVSSSQLLTNIQRYDKLNNVLTLLHRAKEVKENGHEEGKDAPLPMSKLKEQIMTALDEAVRLRAETEMLHDRVEVKPQSIKATSKLKT